MKIDWETLYKIRIANSNSSFQKHEIIKLLIVMKILEKTRNKKWLHIYTEFNLGGIKADVYVEYIKSKSIVCYEIQKELNQNYIELTAKKYKKYEESQLFFKSVDLIIIPLKDCPDNISEINNWLEQFIVQ